MKAVEADSDGKDDVHIVPVQMPAAEGRQAGTRVRKEIEVLEARQGAQTDAGRRDRVERPVSCALLLADQQREKPSLQSDEGEETEESPVPQAIKDIAGDEK